MQVRLALGRLENFSSDVLVNAAGTNMKMNGGVALALKKKGGIEIEQKAFPFAGCKPGQVFPTSAGKLSARYVFHAAVLSSDTGKVTVDTLRLSVRNSLQLADQLKCLSIVFPALGCGAGHFDMERAANIMLAEIKNFKPSFLETVTIILFTSNDLNMFNQVWADGLEPSRVQCLDWIKKRNPAHIVEHIFQVNKIAVFLGQQLQLAGEPINLALVDRASLLHDLDKFETLKKGTHHGYVAEQELKSKGYPELARIVLNHLSHKILESQFPELPWEDKLVWYADRRVRHAEVVSLDERFVYLIERYGQTPEICDKLNASKTKALELEQTLFKILKIAPDLNNIK